MSLHRTLPIPPALSDRGLAQRWGAAPDSLEGARIMTEKKTSTAQSYHQQSSPPPQQNGSSPADVRRSFSPPDSVDISDSPSIGYRTPAPRKRENLSWERAEFPDEDRAASICLCQPDPKVPRPRNAFILYRQHYQASVVASNPGLANPQISKVIGDHWRNAPEDVKNHWRLLAEEEKARHQKQYPGYRYQPRKPTRTNSVSSTLPISESSDLPLTRCAKCGGRSISSASMMTVNERPGAQQINHGHRTSSTIAYSPSRTLTTPTNSGASRSAQSLSSPPSAQAALQGYRYLSQQAKSMALTSPHSKRLDAQELGQHSPESKRRRTNNSVAFVPARSAAAPMSPFPFPPHHQRRESLPRLDSLGPPSLHSPFTMGPPPRYHNQHRPEKSLTLAPLQQASVSASNAAGDTQAKTLEAMILSIPILNKIKILARISAPLAVPPPYSPSASTTTATHGQTSKRGLVIAVDAADPVALKQLTRTLAYSLSEHDVRVIDTPRPDTRMEPSFRSYLRLVDDYHAISAKIKEHITILTSIQSATITTPSPPQPRKRRPKALELERKEESPVSPKSFPYSSPAKATPPMDDDEDDDMDDDDDDDDNDDDDNEHDRYTSHAHEKDVNNQDPYNDRASSDRSGSIATERPKFPIVLLPAWQLTHTDAFACSVEITDRYSPVDHWQWGATVWRGVIGADITVAVKADVGDDSPVKSDSSRGGSGAERERGGGKVASGGGVGVGGHNGHSGGGSKASSIGSQSGGGGQQGGGPGGSGGGNSMSRLSPGVEVRLDEARAVIVRGESEGGVAEGSLRRVGFEVGEWVRTWADREMGKAGGRVEMK